MRARDWLDSLEDLGNRLPHPAMLFVWLCLLALIASALFQGTQAAHPATGETLEVRSLLSGAGLREVLGGMVENFTGFAPLGIVVVALLGVGIAEHSGLLGAALGRLARAAPDSLLVLVVSLAGVLSSLAVDAGYVVLIPLAALLFGLCGRHPRTRPHCWRTSYRPVRNGQGPGNPASGHRNRGRLRANG